LGGCDTLVEMSDWGLRKSGNYGKSWSWFNGRIMTETGVSLDFKPQQKSSFFTKQKDLHIIYIGPWHHSPRINKTIRFFAYTGIGGGNIQYQYESQTEENKNIPEKPFSLPSNLKVAPDRFGLCVVKWTARFGYNAVAEVEYKGFFNKIFRLAPSPTGKIIEAKE